MLTLAVGAVAGLQYAGYMSFAFYAPKYEEVRRDTFEQSRTFREGALRDLENLRLEYLRADQAGKDAMRATVQHRLAGVPNDLLTGELLLFKSQLEGNGG